MLDLANKNRGAGQRESLMKKCLCLFAMYFSLVFAVVPAQEGDTTRRLWDTAFIGGHYPHWHNDAMPAVDAYSLAQHPASRGESVDTRALGGRGATVPRSHSCTPVSTARQSSGWYPAGGTAGCQAPQLQAA